ncbi:NAD(P)-dependent oxidoreductase [Actinacidiphila reveromycinica]|nr:NAD(P)-dependent oxidoreductase [Streptomyces sp. SN-593]
MPHPGPGTGPRPRVVVTESLNDAGVRRLRAAADVVFLDKSLPEARQRATLLDAEVIVSQIHPVDSGLIAAAPRLRAIAKHGVGVDNIDVAAATARGIPVLFAPGANAASVAEHTLAAALAVARRFGELDAAVRRRDFSVRQDLHQLDLEGRTIAVLGYGNTGRRVLGLAHAALGMRGIAYDRFPQQPEALPPGSRYTDSLEEALRGADVVTVHLPLTPQTRGLVGRDQLALLPRGGIVVNVGRGGVVDEYALADALRGGHLFGAAVDVFTTEPPLPDNPLLAPDLRTLLTPHVGGLGGSASVAIAHMLADDILTVLQGGTPSHVVTPDYRSPAPPAVSPTG